MSKSLVFPDSEAPDGAFITTALKEHCIYPEHNHCVLIRIFFFSTYFTFFSPQNASNSDLFEA